MGVTSRILPYAGSKTNKNLAKFAVFVPVRYSYTPAMPEGFKPSLYAKHTHIFGLGAASSDAGRKTPWAHLPACMLPLRGPAGPERERVCLEERTGGTWTARPESHSTGPADSDMAAGRHCQAQPGTWFLAIPADGSLPAGGHFARSYNASAAQQMFSASAASKEKGRKRPCESFGSLA